MSSASSPDTRAGRDTDWLRHTPVLFLRMDEHLQIRHVAGGLTLPGRGPRPDEPLSDGLPEAAESVQEALENGRTPVETEFSRRGRTFQISARDPEDADTEGVVVTLTDVTDPSEAREDMATLVRIGHDIARTDNLRDAARASLPSICSRLPECLAEIWWPESSKELLRSDLLYSLNDALLREIDQHFPTLSISPDDENIISHTLSENSLRETPLTLESESPAEGYFKALADHGLGQAMTVPIPLENQSYFVLAVYLPHPHTRPRSARMFLRSVGTELGLFLKARNQEIVNQAQREKLRGLTLRLGEVQEDERKRLAAALHDYVGHELGLARFKLSEVVRGGAYTPDPPTREHLEDVEAHIREAIRQTRSLSYEYSPRVLQDGGLFQALEWLADLYQDKTGLKIVTDLKGREEPAYPPEIRRLIFDSVKECIYNTWKYAEAGFIRITAFEPDPEHLSVRIEDDGKGFDVELLQQDHRENGGFGLFHMQQAMSHCGGEFVCKSKPGIGTAIRLTMPFPSATPESNP